MSMRDKLYKAVVQSVSGKMLVFIIQIITLALYARLFTPEEFGIIASVQVFVVFFNMLSDVGIGPAIINEKKVSIQKRNGIFTVTLILGILISIVFFLFSYALNAFYSGYEYQSIAAFVCASILFNAVNIVPKTSLVIDAKFILLAKIDVFSELISFVFVVIFYYLGLGLLALVIRSAILSFIKLLSCWLFSNCTSLGRAKFGSEIYHFKSICSFSLYQFSFNFVNYFSRNLDSILIGKFFGMSVLGLYDKAYQLMRYPLTLTSFAMSPAIQPIVTKYRDEPGMVKIEHLSMSLRMLILTLPIAVFMFANAQVIIVFFFGEQWVASSRLVQVFALSIPVQSIYIISTPFYQAMNQPRLLFISGVIAAILNCSAIALGVIVADVNYLAVFLVISFTINLFISEYILYKKCFLSDCKDFYLVVFSAVKIMFPIIMMYMVSKFFVINEIEVGYAFIELLINGAAMIFFVLCFYKKIVNNI